MASSQILANILIENQHLLPSDETLFFADSGAVFRFPAETTFADILVKFDIFSSKGQARKNGWDKPIAGGFSEVIVGKLKHTLWILNPTE
jgi:hypothetical protein